MMLHGRRLPASGRSGSRAGQAAPLRPSRRPPCTLKRLRCSPDTQVLEQAQPVAGESRMQVVHSDVPVTAEGASSQAAGAEPQAPAPAGNPGAVVGTGSVGTAVTPRTLVFVTSEVAPWSKTGGLGDVLGSLPQALAARCACRLRAHGGARTACCLRTALHAAPDESAAHARRARDAEPAAGR